MHILIAEDSKSSIDVIKFLIKKQISPEISEATNGIEALEIIKTHQIDILITDIKMPLMDGLELIEQAYLHQPDLQTIILSAFSNFDYAKRALQNGVADYLLKPINPAEFKKTLNKVILQYKGNQNRNIWKLFDIMLSSRSKDISLPSPLSKYNTICLFSPTDRFIPDCTAISDTIKSVMPDSAIKYSVNNNIIILTKDLDSRIADELYDSISKIIPCFAYSDLFQSNASSLSLCYDTLISYSDDDIFWELEPKNNLLCEKRSNSTASSVFLRQSETIGKHIAECRTDVIESLNEFFSSMQNGGLSSTQCKYTLTEMIKCVFVNMPTEISVDDIINSINLSANVSILKATVTNYVDSILNLSLCDSNESCQNQVVRAAIQIIHNEYMNDINRDKIAARLFISSSYFSSIFKNYIGKGFTSYLNDLRLEKAAEMLKNTTQSVSFIAKSVGYINYPYFCAQFKKKFNMTCIQYRESSL